MRYRTDVQAPGTYLVGWLPCPDLVDMELSLSSAAAVPRREGVLAVDMSNSVTYVNREAELMTGRARVDLIGHPLVCVLGTNDAALPHGRSGVSGRLTGAAHGGQRVGAWLLNRRDSLWIRVEVSVMPIHDRGGRITGAIIVFREVLKLPAGEWIPQQREPTHGEAAAIQTRSEKTGSDDGKGKEGRQAGQEARK